ncbi:MAG: 1-(5-phosphoribosyl)-5-[(5-phosphoribosylamino)methylideneamino]imidazole-4-carboxamide isomerase [Candidatus Bathyarchaeota archaeon]|nr:1-(5-phosphoribosyl)-5-[(5-phosphoribosylamino)methylideneamino]imidazole-4-carboxamide isomerase [Candidatus Bathyarchaeota archaeon]
MLIIPAVDLMGGKCVRLIQGDPNKSKVYYDNPMDAAKLFVEQGASMIHVVDLDAAMMRGENFKVIEKIIKNVPIDIQVAGGIRSLKRIKTMLEIGAYRVVLGTVCIKNPNIVKEASKKFGPSKVMAAIDLKEGVPAYYGWKEKSSVNYIELALNLEQAGVGGLILTCVDVDGTLSGVSINDVANLKNMVSVPIIASGGISSVEDIRKLARLNVEGIIIGKAIYEGKLNLQKALRF